MLPVTEEGGTPSCRVGSMRLRSHVGVQTPLLKEERGTPSCRANPDVTPFARGRAHSTCSRKAKHALVPSRFVWPRSRVGVQILLKYSQALPGNGRGNGSF